MADRTTLDFYAENAATYVAHDSNASSPHLLDFIQSLAAGAAVLELGTGSGRDAERMIRHGLDVTPSDASPELAAEAERRLARHVRIMRFNQLEDVDAYDGVWACAALLHAPVSELTDDLARVWTALRPGGLFVASFKAGSGEGRDRFGRYYNYPDAETLLTSYRQAANWSSLELKSVAGGGYDGLPTEWLWVTSRR